MLMHLGLYAQISPGDLSQAHAEFEGMTNCTLCHELGASVLNSKCLDCHKEIQTTLNNKTGFHSTQDVFGKDCIECHSDHHGRKFNMIRFDTIQFNHSTVGYELQGKHLDVDCALCHSSKNRVDESLLERSKTYLGLNQECLSCHEDQHQETLDNDCLKCHDMNGFDAVPNFNHNVTSFKLLGAHKEEDCISCHEVTTRNNKEFQQFSGLEFTSCVACHEDPHQDQLPGACDACHSESSFTSIKKRGFAHNRLTNFELKGKHNEVSCFDCHKESSNPSLVFQDLAKVGVNECASCHEDIHQPSLGNSCSECHNENGFNQGVALGDFNHDLTHYPLVGKHLSVDCKSCHKESVTASLAFGSCTDCHEDEHQGAFNLDVQYNCDSCHNIVEGFKQTTFGFEQHNQLTFPLEGAHMATPCSSCHLSDSNWTFNQEKDCASCHDDVHEGNFAIAEQTDCSRCHVSDDWSPTNFDHSTTRFPLDGKHIDLDCTACHLDARGNTLYKLNKLQCIDCHS